MGATATRVVEKRAEPEGHPQQAARKAPRLEVHRRGQIEGPNEALFEDHILIVYEVAEGIRLSMFLGKYH